MSMADAANIRLSPPVTPYRRIRGLSIAGVVLIAIFVLGLGVWSAYAPLQSASLASGVVAVQSSRKTIQHLEGGIISAILVRDGDLVTTGQPLIRLDDVKARTTLAALQGQLWDALASEARLVAQREDDDQISFPDSLTMHEDEPVVARVLAAQRGIFDTQRSLLQSKTALIRQRIAETHDEITGLKAQVSAAEQQTGFLREELEGVRLLMGKGLERRPHLLALERDLAQVEGQRGQELAEIARANQSIAESEVNILNLRNDVQRQVADEARDTQKSIHELQERMQAATDVMARTIVRAPEPGTVTDLRFHTPGGVINAGDPLMELVPEQDRMVVEAKLRPQDIDVVHVGLPAHVRLLPYKQRRTPAIDGEVIYVSADALVDKATNQTYYAAKIRVDDAELAKMRDVKMTPGMPSEVMIKTGETTVALYALAPLVDNFHRAFREK